MCAKGRRVPNCSKKCDVRNFTLLIFNPQAFKITAIFFLVSMLWIGVGDYYVTKNTEEFLLSITKASIYVILVSILIYWLILKEFREQERKQQERIANLQGRHKAMKDMLFVVSHHWRQPLTALSLMIDGFSDFAKERDIKSTERYARECHTIIRNLSDTLDVFTKSEAKKEMPTKVSIIKVVIDSFFSATEGSLQDIELSITCKSVDDSASVFLRSQEGVHVSNDLLRFVIGGYPARLKQVFLIFFANSVYEFETKGGKALAKARIHVAIDLRKKGICSIIIQDNAGGVESDIEYIFDPFFTTKGIHSHKGLGLYRAKQLIEADEGASITALNSEYDKVTGLKLIMQIPDIEVESGV